MQHRLGHHLSYIPDIPRVSHLQCWAGSKQSQALGPTVPGSYKATYTACVRCCQAAFTLSCGCMGTIYAGTPKATMNTSWSKPI